MFNSRGRSKTHSRLQAIHFTMQTYNEHSGKNNKLISLGYISSAVSPPLDGSAAEFHHAGDLIAPCLCFIGDDAWASG